MQSLRLRILAGLFSAFFALWVCFLCCRCYSFFMFVQFILLIHGVALYSFLLDFGDWQDLCLWLARNPGLFESAADEIVRRGVEYLARTPQNLSNTLWSYGVVASKPHHLMSAFEHHLTAAWLGWWGLRCFLRAVDVKSFPQRRIGCLRFSKMKTFKDSGYGTLGELESEN